MSVRPRRRRQIERAVEARAFNPQAYPLAQRLKWRYGWAQKTGH